VAVALLYYAEGIGGYLVCFMFGFRIRGCASFRLCFDCIIRYFRSLKFCFKGSFDTLMVLYIIL